MPLRPSPEHGIKGPDRREAQVVEVDPGVPWIQKEKKPCISLPSLVGFVTVANSDRPSSMELSHHQQREMFAFQEEDTQRLPTRAVEPAGSWGTLKGESIRESWLIQSGLVSRTPDMETRLASIAAFVLASETRPSVVSHTFP